MGGHHRVGGGLLTGDLARVEARRLRLQARLEGVLRPLVRNRLGQHATPPDLARAVVAEALRLLPGDGPLHLLDPAFGTGALYAAFRAEAGRRAGPGQGFEVDPDLVAAARDLWAGWGLDLVQGDFTAATPGGPPADLVVCNPPYTRHHHLDAPSKARLRAAVAGEVEAVSGLAGLHVYFVLASRRWMAPGGVGAWILPAEALDVNYGVALRRFLRHRVSLVRVHRLDPADCQFPGALVSTALLFFRNRPPGPGDRACFSAGGTLDRPRETAWIPLDALDAEERWGVPGGPSAEGAALGDRFFVRRGLATGGDAFFTLPAARALALGLPAEVLRPVLPPPRRLCADEVASGGDGLPRLCEPRVLLDCRVPEPEVQDRWPALWAYLSSGIPEISGRYLCRHRTPWYAQERRPPPPLLCTYMGRKALRFVLNPSSATATNTWMLLYPREPEAWDPARLRRFWMALQALDPALLQGVARTYGGGLKKVEPSDLRRLPLPAGW